MYFLQYTKFYLFIKVLICIHELRNIIFGITVDRQTGRNIGDICSLQITFPCNMTLMKCIHHRLFQTEQLQKKGSRRPIGFFLISFLLIVSEQTPQEIWSLLLVGKKYVLPVLLFYFRTVTLSESPNPFRDTPSSIFLYAQQEKNPGLY